MKEKTQAVTLAASEQTQAVTLAADYGADTGIGFDGQNRDTIVIPRLVVLQALSPQCSSNDAARPGMLFNTVTEELTPGATGRVFVPACRRHHFNEWVDRTKGGGLVGSHAPESAIVQNAKQASTEWGQYFSPAGNRLVETVDIYGVLLDNDGLPDGMAILSFSSTKLSEYKHWNTKVAMFMVKTASGNKVRPPLFAHQVRVCTKKEKNAKGEFFNYDLKPAKGNLLESLLPPGHPALEAAKELRSMVEEGGAKAADEHGPATVSPDQAWNV